jgi:hypothetical protein
MGARKFETRRCAECGSYFAPTQGRQMFCAPLCASRSRNRSTRAESRRIRKAIGRNWGSESPR